MRKSNCRYAQRSFLPGDLALGAMLTLLSLVPLFSTNIFGSVKGDKVSIYRNGRLEYSLPLGANAEVRVGNMRIAVKDRKAAVLDSDCPGKICVHTGWIAAAGGKIVCVPNRVMIEIAGADETGSPDAVSY